jgi:hypothetical protein
MRIFGFTVFSSNESILMSLGSPIHTHSAKVGTCPHGLPLGACPICNGMAGGNSTTKRDIPRNVGEMTYNQCAAIGAMLKAQKHAKAQAKETQQNYLQSLVNFSKNIAQLHQKLMDLTVLLSNSTPALISKPINFILTNFVGRILIVFQNIPNMIVNIAQGLSQKFVEISDKLVAIFGEIKTAISEKVSKFVARIKKKLFFIFGTSEADDEEKKIEEAKRTFELKTFIHSLIKNFKKEKDTEKDEY